MQTIGVIAERGTYESRVGIIPQVAQELLKTKKYRIVVERDAGLKAGFSNEEYAQKGCELKDSKDEVIAHSDIVVAVDGRELAPQALANKIAIALFDPYANQELITSMKEQGASIIALELIPRLSRAQSMDVLSSQANIAGYKAVLMAASKINKILPLMMTAAGTIKPAQVLVLGAGVLGLQAIATAKRLGAIVHAYDVRSVVKEQVESLGAKFVNVTINEGGEGQGGYATTLSPESAQEQRSRLSAFAKNMDIIITTAQIPGRTAPRLLDESIFSSMRDGSVIIDCASKSGGNVAGSVPHEWRKMDNTWLYGADDLARQMPRDASLTFSKNIAALLELILEKPKLDQDDEILREALVCANFQWVSARFNDHIKNQPAGGA